MELYRFPILYKKAVNGKISSWEIKVVGSEIIDQISIVTTHGYTDGIKQIDQQVVSIAKSQINVAEQAKFEANSKWIKYTEKGYTKDPSGVSQMQVYLPMLAKKYAEQGDKIKWPCYIQPKLNGARCISYIKDGKRVYQSRLGKFWTTLTHLDRDLIPFDGLITDGEIYVHGMDLQDILSLIKNQDTTTTVEGLRAENLEYHIYDLVSNERFESRINNLRDILLSLYALNINKHLHLVETYLIGNEKELLDYHKKFLTEGYEGSMLRNVKSLYQMNRRSNDLQKVKPVLSEEFEVIGGYCVETGREQGTCVFTCKTKKGETFDVRPKGTLERRRQYWKELAQLKGKMLTVDFQEWTGDGKPFHARGVAIRDYE